MSADVTGFLTVVMMGLTTMIAIIGGYLLLNSAVNNIVRENAYYTFTWIADTISNSMQSSSASATNLHLTPKYVIFTAYFPSEYDVPYFAFDGQRMNHIAVNQEDKGFFRTIKESSSGDSVYNEGVPSREELLKCVNDACICIGEMTTYLSLEPSHLIPGACVEICWGENTPDYDACLTDNYNSYSTPRELMQECNDELASDSDNVMCKKCVDYMNHYDSKLTFLNEEGYNVLMIDVADIGSSNAVNYNKLSDFSTSTKYSFIPVIIECKSMSELALSAGRNSYCTQNKPYLFNYVSSDEENRGIMGVLSVDSAYEDGLIFKLINVDYYQDATIQPSTCYAYNSFVKTEGG